MTCVSAVAVQSGLFQWPAAVQRSCRSDDVPGSLLPVCILGVHQPGSRLREHIYRRLYSLIAAEGRKQLHERAAGRAICVEEDDVKGRGSALRYCV
jgi:hypothetical protein